MEAFRYANLPKRGLGSIPSRAPAYSMGRAVGGPCGTGQDSRSKPSVDKESQVGKLLRIGNRVIDLEAVVAAEQEADSLTVFLAGIGAPFHFEAAEAQAVWAALHDGDGAAVASEQADDLPEFQLMELPSDENDEMLGASRA